MQVDTHQNRPMNELPVRNNVSHFFNESHYRCESYFNLPFTIALYLPSVILFEHLNCQCLYSVLKNSHKWTKKMQCPRLFPTNSLTMQCIALSKYAKNKSLLLTRESVTVCYIGLNECLNEGVIVNTAFAKLVKHRCKVAALHCNHCWNGSMVNHISSSCAFPAMTGPNGCGECWATNLRCRCRLERFIQKAHSNSFQRIACNLKFVQTWFLEKGTALNTFTPWFSTSIVFPCKILTQSNLRNFMNHCISY